MTRTYIASGTFGMLAAELDAEERAERQAKVEAWKQTRKDMEALDAQFSAWWTASSTLIDAYLTVHGYYRHKRGPWRKRADPKELRQLLNKANKGDKQAFDTVCTRLPDIAWFWEKAGNMAYQAQEAMLTGFLGEDALLTHEAQRRKCTALRRDLEGPTPTSIERLLVDRVVLCWLHLHYAEAVYAQNMMQLSLMQHDYYQRRLSMAQRRYLSAITALAQVRRLLVPNVQVNIAEQQLNVAAITSAQPQQHAERTAR